MAKVDVLPLAVIEENPQALRTKVNKESCAYEELKNGIKAVGLLNPISVREYTKDTGQVGYRLVDGLHRKTACQDLGYTEVPVNIVTVDDSKLLVAQIIGNQNVKTTKTQYAQALKTLLQHEGLTVKELARKVQKGEKWVNDNLGLLDLPESLHKLIDEGKLPVLNALALRKVSDRMDDFLQEAMTQPPTIFVPKIEEVVKEARSAAFQGRKPNVGFKPMPKFRKPSEVKAIYLEIEATGGSSEIRTLLETQGITNPYDAANAVVKFMLSLDPVSVAAEKARYDAEVVAKAETKRKREAEAEAKKNAAAAQEVAKLAV